MHVTLCCFCLRWQRKEPHLFIGHRQHSRLQYEFYALRDCTLHSQGRVNLDSRDSRSGHSFDTTCSARQQNGPRLRHLPVAAKAEPTVNSVCRRRSPLDNARRRHDQHIGPPGTEPSAQPVRLCRPRCRTIHRREIARGRYDDGFNAVPSRPSMLASEYRWPSITLLLYSPVYCRPFYAFPLPHSSKMLTSRAVLGALITAWQLQPAVAQSMNALSVLCDAVADPSSYSACIASVASTAAEGTTAGSLSSVPAPLTTSAGNEPVDGSPTTESSVVEQTTAPVDTNAGSAAGTASPTTSLPAVPATTDVPGTSVPAEGTAAESTGVPTDEETSSPATTVAPPTTSTQSEPAATDASDSSVPAEDPSTASSVPLSSSATGSPSSSVAAPTEATTEATDVPVPAATTSSTPEAADSTAASSSPVGSSAPPAETTESAATGAVVAIGPSITGQVEPSALVIGSQTLEPGEALTTGTDAISLDQSSNIILNGATSPISDMVVPTSMPANTTSTNTISSLPPEFSTVTAESITENQWVSTTDSAGEPTSVPGVLSCEDDDDDDDCNGPGMVKSPRNLL